MAHTFPHDPQLLVSVIVSAHVVPQRVPPVLHMHTPATHVPVVPHPLSHMPQCIPSVCRSAHAAPHIIRGALHPHRPPAHWYPGLHRTPQPPQFIGSVCTLAQVTVPIALHNRPGIGQSATHIPNAHV